MSLFRQLIIAKKKQAGGSANDYLCFTAQEGGSTVRLVKNGNPGAISLEYSTDRATWSSYTVGGTITLASAGDKVYFRGDNAYFNKVYNKFYRFAMTGTIAASGNVMSLVDSSLQSKTIPCVYCFTHLFDGCVSLTSAPALPATELKNDCYCYMFYGCTKLAGPVVLPSATLANYCYQLMFNNCTSLSSVEVAFEQWNDSIYATHNWLYNVASSGTFTCPAGLDATTRDASHVPSGWTVNNGSSGGGSGGGSGSSVLTVSGASYSSVNGTYADSGETYNGQPVYALSGTNYVIYCSSMTGGWIIYEKITGMYDDMILFCIYQLSSGGPAGTYSASGNYSGATGTCTVAAS